MSQYPPPGNEPPPPYDPSQEKCYPPPGQYPPSQPGYPPPGQYPPPISGQPVQYPPPTGGQYPPPTGQYPPGATYPAPGYQQVQPQMTTTTTVIAQPATLTTFRFTEFPTQIQCPHCHAQVVTACDYTDGTAVWLIAVVICLLGAWLGCCLIPFCVQGLKDVNHRCPNCNRVVGVFKRM